MSKLTHSTDEGMAAIDRRKAHADGEAKCETHGHIFGHRSACMFCGAPKPERAKGGANG